MTTLQELAAMDSGDLARVYASSYAGPIPDGDSNGKAIVLPGTATGKVLSAVANLLWKGKIVDSANGRVVNKILGLRLVKAEVFLGQSWSDGNESIIIDYKKTSWVACFIRDEIRLAEPGLYLGKAYIRLPFESRFSHLYFALDFRK